MSGTNCACGHPIGRHGGPSGGCLDCGCGGWTDADAVPACGDCGRLYGDEYGFPDLVIPDDAWRKISPTGDEGGLLCPSCMCARLENAGVVTSGVFRSGPLSAPLLSVYTESGDGGYNIYQRNPFRWLALVEDDRGLADYLVAVLNGAFLHNASRHLKQKSRKARRNKRKRDKATPEEFAPVNDPEPGRRVRVEGWARQARFVYQTTDENGYHVLRTPRTNRVYRTNHRLLEVNGHARS